MDTQTVFPENIEERIVWHGIRATYVFYALGALYIVAPLLAWCLLIVLLSRAWRCGSINPSFPSNGIPTAIWLWVGGMLVMMFALLVGHMDFALGVAKTIKSSLGWAKGWALLAIFPLLGCLNIRAAIIYRASMHVCLHTILLLPLFIAAWLFGLPQTLYVSPLEIIGGPGPEFFAVSLYEIDPGSGSPRWRLFTPWAPALGFIANIFFVFAIQEQNLRWRTIGIVGSVAMILMSGSRLALVSLLIVWLMSWLLAHLRNTQAPFVAAWTMALSGVMALPLKQGIEQLSQTFRAARAGSSRVREALARIAIDRWSNEALVWGHGVVERGPHLVEFMPIGSHHTWYGLLFVKGIVGAIALAVPLVFSLAQLSWWSGQLPTARVGLAMALLLVLYTFGENLEILAYLIWPALLVMGISHREIDIASSHPSLNHHSSSEQVHHA